MTAIAAHELVQIRNCKVAGCPDYAHYKTGSGAGMCHTHGLAVYRAQQARIVEIRQQRGTYRGRTAPKTGAITDAAREVLAASKRLDVALDAVYQAEQRRDLATAGWRDAVNTLIRTVNSELPRPSDAADAAIDREAA